MLGGLGLGYYFATVYTLPAEFASIITSTEQSASNLASLQIIASRLPTCHFRAKFAGDVNRFIPGCLHTRCCCHWHLYAAMAANWLCGWSVFIAGYW